MDEAMTAAKPTDAPVITRPDATDAKGTDDNNKVTNQQATTATNTAGTSTTATAATYHAPKAQPRSSNKGKSADEAWNPSEDEKTERMKEFFEDDNSPKVKVDHEEFQKDCAKYGLKTLKDSRWAEAPKANVAQKESRKDSQKSGSGGKPKGLQDSRWAN